MVTEHGRGRRPQPPRRAPRRSRPSSADRRDPDVDRLDAGVGRDDRVGRPQELLAEQLGDLRFADPCQAVRARRRPSAPSAARLRAGAATWSAHIGRISRGGPGRATTTRPSGRSTNQPGAVPFGFGSAAADGISQACLRFISGNGIPRRRPELAQPGLESGSTAASRRSPRRSPRGSGRRASGRGRRSRRRGRPASRPVANASVTAPRSSGRAVIRPTADAQPGQAPGQLAGVGVARLADRQLAADAQQLGGQEAGGVPRLTSFRSVALRRVAWLAGWEALLSSKADPAPEPDPEHSPGRSERDPRTHAAGPPLRRRSGPPPRARARSRPGLPTSSRPLVTRRSPSSWRTSNSPRPRPVRSPAKSGGSPALGALAIALVIFAVFLVVIGTSLWLGEWLLGSMGWGVLHGFLLFVSVAMAAVLGALGIAPAAPRRRFRCLGRGRDRGRRRARARAC